MLAMHKINKSGLQVGQKDVIDDGIFHKIVCRLFPPREISLIKKFGFFLHM